VKVHAKRALVDECIAKAGVIGGGKVCLRLVQWATIAAHLGHFPTVDEFSVAAVVSHATAGRYRQTIRAHFSEEEFRAIVEQLVEQGVATVHPRAARQLAIAV
jgi:hypothetical protein